MDSTNRIVVNTVVQYFRSIINILLSLYSTRLIVDALGASDYGIYVVIGGVVAMLGFITNALVLTTQRYVSFYFGKDDKDAVRSVFVNSLFLHIVFSCLIFTILLVLKDTMIHTWLRIPSDRLDAASYIYVVTACVLVVSIIIAPFKALFIARENIVYISMVEIADGFLKLGIAFFILNTSLDKLVLYVILMFCIQMFNLSVFALYAGRRFDECCLIIRPRDIDMNCIRQLVGFAGWSTYSMGAVVFRTQGMQVLLNRAFGTVVNAALGLSFQVFGSVSFVASSVLNAMNPQIIKAEGEGNRSKMFQMASKESKYSSLLLILILIPIIFEAKGILSCWLKEMPDKTDVFCRFVLSGLIIDQMTYGLNTANQAIGKIRNYSILMYTPKLLVLVPMYFLSRNSADPTVLMWAYLGAEVFVSMARLPYFSILYGFSIKKYMSDVLFPVLPVLMVQMIVGFVFTHCVNIPYRFLVSLPVSFIVGVAFVWQFSLNVSEKQYTLKMLHISKKQ